MPRKVRNFWIEAIVDGRKTPIAFGPQGKDGGFELTVYMRDKGEVESVLSIKGALSKEDDLTLLLDCAGAWTLAASEFSTKIGKWHKLYALFGQR